MDQAQLDELRWREKGKCWGTHKTGRSGALDPWFPQEGTSLSPTSADLQREEAAGRLCAGCPVLSDCLEYALVRTELTGVWGGMLTRQRKVERRRRHRSVRWQQEHAA